MYKENTIASPPKVHFKHVCFHWATFWGVSDVHQCANGLEMAVAALNKQELDCRSPCHWFFKYIEGIFKWIVYAYMLC